MCIKNVLKPVENRFKIAKTCLKLRQNCDKTASAFRQKKGRYQTVEDLVFLV